MTTGEEKVADWKIPPSIGFRGAVCHRSAKASRGEDLDIEKPVRSR
jgi:hypothetical protein